MKKITCMALMAAALLMATPAQAQFSFGVKGGVTLGSNDLMAFTDKDYALDLNNYAGFFIGPKMELRIPILGFGLEAAALYSQKGMTIGDNETFKQNSFLIPLNVKYAFGIGNFANIFIAAGPEFGFNVGETQRVFNNLTTDDITNVTTGGISAYVAKKSTLAINVGAGITLLNHLQVALNYNMPWGKTSEFTYIDSSEIENAENIKNGGEVSYDTFEKLTGTMEKAELATSYIKAGTIQLSVAYLF